MIYSELLDHLGIILFSTANVQTNEAYNNVSEVGSLGFKTEHAVICPFSFTCSSFCNEAGQTEYKKEKWQMQNKYYFLF